MSAAVGSLIVINVSNKMDKVIKIIHVVKCSIKGCEVVSNII